jgi:glycosyltransferase involved in cell wall biosynthesis
VNRFYIDIAPLQETEYTGIPQVTSQLCARLLGDDSIDPGFFYGRHEVPPAIVENLLSSRDGRLFRWASERYCLHPIVRPPVADGVTVALHTNMKFARRIFPIEGQIVHDLTTVVTPHYHTAETNAYHLEKFFGDLMSNDVTFCVSESTAADLRTFYGDIPGPIVVSHLGVDWSHVAEETRRLELETEAFIFVLGTLEPRKNVGDILDLLALRPELTRRYRFIFGGRVGWGDAFEAQIAERGLSDMLERGRILKTGFVSEATKYLLIRNARLLLYPSVYEGFGLPVAEAISLGTPVVTTPSSSLPEVGRELAFYFKPGDLESLQAALESALQSRPSDPARISAEASWREHFSWARCYATTRDALLAAASKRAAASPAVKKDPQG